MNSSRKQVQKRFGRSFRTHLFGAAVALALLGGCSTPTALIPMGPTYIGPAMAYPGGQMVPMPSNMRVTPVSPAIGLGVGLGGVGAWTGIGAY